MAKRDEEDGKDREETMRKMYMVVLSCYSYYYDCV